MSVTNIKDFTTALESILNAGDLHLNDAIAEAAANNTLGVTQNVVGVAHPRTLHQVSQIVNAANRFEIALYPVSQGKNIGYGEMTPHEENQLVINLKNLNAIREYDDINGEVVVEPGVTQQQLSDFLKDKNSRFMADMTGASPEASIIGNTLEAGFGHSPLGDHRKHILAMEVILANGQVMTTGEMPSVGPDLAQLFVQSNFGVVTALRIPLFRMPEKILIFALSFQSDDDYFKSVMVLRDLRQQGIITSLVHTANSTRTLMTSSRFPSEIDRAQVLDEKQCREILNSKSPIDVGAWTAIGGLYGMKSEVSEKAARIKKAFQGLAKVRIFSDRKLNTIIGLLNSAPALKLKKLDLLRTSFKSLKALHGILHGQPSYVPSENIFWRVNNMAQMGLAWHAPVIPATSSDLSILITSTRPIFAKYGFEMPVTLTMINHKHLTAVFNINFDKTSPDETRRARLAYKELSDLTSELGYEPYRLGLNGNANKIYGSVKSQFLKEIKRAIDPKNILAPGRYGLSGGDSVDVNRK